jgi:hypothetical protein
MTIAELLKADESKTLEFKRDMSSPRNLLKTLVAFANTAGGRIVIGVADKTPIGQIGPAAQQVTQQVRKMLAVCVGEASRAELMKTVGLKDRVTFARNYLEPVLAGAFIEMTQPDSPTSPTQKYRLTTKGKSVLEGGV